MAIETTDTIDLKKKPTWTLHVMEHNRFNGKLVAQVYRDDELRGSFLLDPESEKDDLLWWQSILGEKAWK